jgi:hypothetical protein
VHEVGQAMALGLECGWSKVIGIVMRLSVWFGFSRSWFRPASNMTSKQNHDSSGARTANNQEVLDNLRYGTDILYGKLEEPFWHSGDPGLPKTATCFIGHAQLDPLSRRTSGVEPWLCSCWNILKYSNSALCGLQYPNQGPLEPLEPGRNPLQPRVVPRAHCVAWFLSFHGPRPFVNLSLDVSCLSGNIWIYLGFIYFWIIESEWVFFISELYEWFISNGTLNYDLRKKWVDIYTLW